MNLSARRLARVMGVCEFRHAVFLRRYFLYAYGNVYRCMSKYNLIFFYNLIIPGFISFELGQRIIALSNHLFVMF